MRDTDLIGPYNPDDALAWEQGRPRSARQFVAEVLDLANLLPDRPAVLNLATSRYKFFVGFAAAILRRQVTLLPQSRAPEALRLAAGDYPGTYALTDRGEAVEGLESVPLGSREITGPWPETLPPVPVNQVVAIAFTSGSTGRPMPNKKTWGALTTVARATGARLGIKSGERTTVVATVPHQHMFGLEASVMLPVMHGLVMHAGRPHFPADIGSALRDVGGRWLLVTTPLHLRACVAEKLGVPPGGLILSATAPLAWSLAEEAERAFQSEVREIFGFAEAGSVAERRTINGDRWRPLDGVRVVQSGSACAVQAEYLPAPVRVPDRITVDREGMFVVHGREADQVKVAGHRVSLGELNQKLLEIDGVQDGIVFLPEEDDSPVTRPMAFVVAPGRSSEEIQRELRARVDPVFLPRPVVCVPSLPRNATGKLPRESVVDLARHWREQQGHGA
jgi:acyl-coenzyme A synthetase/AMP-(fatty) acid ligase